MRKTNPCRRHGVRGSGEGHGKLKFRGPPTGGSTPAVQPRPTAVGAPCGRLQNSERSGRYVRALIARVRLGVEVRVGLAVH